MSKLTLLLLFIFTTLNSFGQDRHIVLQIDTLILNGYDKFSISLTGQGNPNFPTFLNDTVYIKNPIGQPNFICPLTLKTDSSNIRITIDDQGGYLQLIDAYKLKGDTIKINKVFVFENCINDTTFTRIAYYIKKPDGSIGKPFKTKRSKSINKKKCKVKALNKVEYRVNNVSYFALFQEQKDSGLKITEFHGYKPRKYLEDRDNYKGKITYFHGSSTTSRYINVITIKISH